MQNNKQSLFSSYSKLLFSQLSNIVYDIHIEYQLSYIVSFVTHQDQRGIEQKILEDSPKQLIAQDANNKSTNFSANESVEEIGENYSKNYIEFADGWYVNEDYLRESAKIEQSRSKMDDDNQTPSNDDPINSTSFKL